MKAVCLFAVFMLAFASAEVLNLEKDNFDDTIKENELTLVKFFAPWCGHCKKLAPEYEKAAENLKEKGFDKGVLAEVDCTTDNGKPLCTDYGVRGFPTVKLFRNDGSDPVDYDKARNTDAIVGFMEKQGAPAITELDSVDAVADFAASDNIRIIAYTNDQELGDYTKVANSMRNDFSFALVKGVAEVDGCDSIPCIVVKRTFDDGDKTFSDLSEDYTTTLKDFIIENSFPLVGEIGPENYAKYVERGLDFAWIFVDYSDEDQKKLVEDVVIPVAKDYRKISFVKLDGIKWKQHGEQLGLTSTTPGFVVEQIQKKRKFIFSGEPTLENYKQWMEDYSNDKLEPHLKSEAIPEDNSEPVTVVVGKSFNDVVLDKSKDVFVKFYAPWCGHCKSLAPKWEELGKEYEGDANMVIAKVDATANDVPADVRGFPTLIFFKAGENEEVKYEGERTVEAFKEFLEKNRASEAAAPAAGDEEKEDL